MPSLINSCTLIPLPFIKEEDLEKHLQLILKLKVGNPSYSGTWLHVYYNSAINSNVMMVTREAGCGISAFTEFIIVPGTATIQELTNTFVHAEGEVRPTLIRQSNDVPSSLPKLAEELLALSIDTIRVEHNNAVICLFIRSGRCHNLQPAPSSQLCG